MKRKLKTIKALSLAALMSVNLNFFGQNVYANSNTEQTSLVFDESKYEIKSIDVNGKTIKYRAYENIVYVENPVDTKYQVINFYVPIEYYEGKSINGYTKDTAPIFLPNSVGGYMPGEAKKVEDVFKPMMRNNQNNTQPQTQQNQQITTQTQPNQQMTTEQVSTIAKALEHGYVVASIGARGRTNTDENGNNTGKAPAVIVDLKAGVKYLHYNDEKMPGDANKIISNGTSAGGAVSALLGASGNNDDYDKYLEELGAAPANDDIYAVSAYCPITNLENADMAYEWSFNGVEFSKDKGPILAENAPDVNNQNKTLTEEEQQLSLELKSMFTDYLNSLNLTSIYNVPLTLNQDGNGTFKTYVGSFIMKSAQKALDEGQDLSSYDYLTIKNGVVTDVDVDGYFKAMGRKKSVFAFDSLTGTSAENSLFGTKTTDASHFTLLAKQNATDASQMADTQTVKLMNPMNYIGAENTDTAKYWRIRHGSLDSDTSVAIPIILDTVLKNKGFNSDFQIAWGQKHAGDYDVDELFAWIDSICK